jgi:hypothetical protein
VRRARLVPLPQVAPVHPVLAKPFHRDGWVYEEKIDGWRILAVKRDGVVPTVTLPPEARDILSSLTHNARCWPRNSLPDDELRPERAVGHHGEVAWVVQPDANPNRNALDSTHLVRVASD